MIQFGTGGWRAVIADGYTKVNLRLLAAALAEKMIAEHETGKGIVIGYDRRFLSKESMQWMAEVFAAKNIKAYLINKSCPTPVAMFYAKEHDLPYGLMVTASHNPAIYNGVKVFTKGGRDADPEVTQEIESIARRIEASGEPVAAIPYEDARAEGLIEEIYPIDDYIDSILNEVNVRAIRKARLKVALDPMYGVSETAIKTILITARCEVETIHGTHDTLFGGHLPAPDEKWMRERSNTVVQGNYDIGIATDGDADRIGVVDNNGRYLSPNDLLVVLYYYLEKYKGKKGAAVRNLCTTHRLDRLAEVFGEERYEVPVGFQSIPSKLAESEALLGGESSGGLSVRGHIHGKDGIYVAALLVEMLAVTGKKMSEIFDEIAGQVGRVAYIENNYRFRPEDREEYHRILMIEKKVPEMPCRIEKVTYMDGCKIFFANGGWVSIRFSGTEPLLRVFCEMPERSMTEQVCETCRAFLGLRAPQ